MKLRGMGSERAEIRCARLAHLFEQAIVNCEPRRHCCAHCCNEFKALDCLTEAGSLALSRWPKLREEIILCHVALGKVDQFGCSRGRVEDKHIIDITHLGK